jgi:hypothetical protein
MATLSMLRMVWRIPAKVIMADPAVTECLRSAAENLNAD